MKLGELLTRRGMITESQLEEALNAQLIHGGHLGTCLIERDFITEEQLGQVLADSFNIGCASKVAFESIPRFVVGMMPTHLVEKHQAVPFRLEKDCLDVAMVDPTDLRAIDELTFATGHNVRAWIAPEIRIVQAMDRYFGIARRMRYITLSQHLDNSSAEAAGDGANQLIWEPSSEPESDSSPETEKDVPTEPSAAPAAGMSSAGVPGDSGTPDPAGAMVDQMVAAAGEAEAVATLEADIAEPAADPSLASDHEFSELSELFVRVAGRKKLGQLAVEFASRSLPRAVLFEVDASHARPWDWAGVDIPASARKELSFEITSEPMFALLRGERYYRAALPYDDDYKAFFDSLGIEPAREVLLVPAYSDDRLIALLYADAGRLDPDSESSGLPEDVAPYLRLLKKVGLALDLIRIKQRIRSS